MVSDAAATQHQVEVFHLRAQKILTHSKASSDCVLDRTINAIKTIEDSKQQYFLYDCRWRLTQYRLEYLPAIVIDAQFVSYGLRNIDKALALVEAIDD